MSREVMVHTIWPVCLLLHLACGNDNQSDLPLLLTFLSTLLWPASHQENMRLSVCRLAEDLWPSLSRRPYHLQGGPSGRGKPPVDLVPALSAAAGPLL